MMRLQPQWLGTRCRHKIKTLLSRPAACTLASGPLKALRLRSALWLLPLVLAVNRMFTQ